MNTPHFQKFIGSFALLILCVILIGCSATPTQLTIKTKAVSDLNPDVDGKPSPVVVTLYQLNNPANFNKASYQALAEHQADTLGDNLIDAKNLEIRPNESITKNYIIWPKTQYIGISAAYRNIDQAHWKGAINLYEKSKKHSLKKLVFHKDSLGKRKKITILLESQSLVINPKSSS